MSEAMICLIARGLLETVVMTLAAGVFGFILGLPTGIFLFITRDGQVLSHKTLNRIIALIVNIFRSIPFIILIVWMIPFTRLIVGTSIGMWAALVPLSIGSAPFIARMVENSLLEIPYGIIEASQAMGVTPLQLIVKILLPEALPSIINGVSIILIAIVGYSAMGGAVGAGGLGQIGYQYGYVGYDATVMNVVLVLLLLFVLIIQTAGDFISKKVDHRK